jgi:nitric oxide reductase NorE protein
VTRAAVARRVPGEEGLWVFILGDMTMFGVFFAAFLYERSAQPALFASSREALMPAVGAVNTLVLLTSSLFVAAAVRAHRDGRRDAAARLVGAAGLCALMFAGLKATEWVLEIQGGHTPRENSFFLYYYLLTGVHFAHVVIGSVVLIYWWLLLRRPPKTTGESRVVECCASYWHMVDLLWLVLFPVVYMAST